MTDNNRTCWQRWRERGCRAFCRKYFWEGQLVQDDEIITDVEDANNVAVAEDENNNGSVGSTRHSLSPTARKLLAPLIPLVVVHFFWWSYMIKNNLWHCFETKYFMTITMVFGSIIAGMTSEGGGAVAFPVMTLAAGVDPSVARDFSIMIQSCGMSAASFCIFFMKIRLEYNALVFCSLGGAFGSISGLHLVDPYLTASQKKMCFASIWFSFAFALFLLNRERKRKVFLSINKCFYVRRSILFLVGCVGGVFTSFAGSGLDICSFSVLTLLFRVSEKVATPTSVVLMAGNSIVVFLWRSVVLGLVSQDAWEFLVVCVPVVVIGAPCGSLLGSHFHRLVLASCVYILDVAALVGAFAIVPQTPLLTGVSCAIIVVGFLVFFALIKFGSKLLEKQDREVTLTSAPCMDGKPGGCDIETLDLLAIEQCNK